MHYLGSSNHSLYDKTIERTNGGNFLGIAPDAWKVNNKVLKNIPEYITLVAIDILLDELKEYGVTLESVAYYKYGTGGYDFDHENYRAYALKFNINGKERLYDVPAGVHSIRTMLMGMLEAIKSVTNDD